MSKIKGVAGGIQVRKMKVFFLVYIHLPQNIRGSADEEDGGYLKKRGGGLYSNREGGKIEGLVKLVQSNMKLAKPYACWKMWE